MDHFILLAQDRKRDVIYIRLSTALETLREQGVLSEAAYEQALGREPRPEHCHVADGLLERMGADAHRRSLPEGEAPATELSALAEVFLNATTPAQRAAAMLQHTKLEAAFAIDAMAKIAAREHPSASKAERTVFVRRMRTWIVDTLRQDGEFPAIDVTYRDVER